MHMVGHQAVRVQAAAARAEQAPQMEKIKAAIARLIKARLPVVATMHYVDRHSRKHDASTPGHACSTSHRAAPLTGRSHEKKTWSVPDLDQASSSIRRITPSRFLAAELRGVHVTWQRIFLPRRLMASS